MSVTTEPIRRRRSSQQVRQALLDAAAETFARSGYGGASTAPRLNLVMSQTDTRWLREEFLWVASHELRTPLTGLSLNLQLLQSRAVFGFGAVLGFTAFAV